MERTAVLYIVRLCVPLILVIFLSLYFFYVNDSYHQLDLSFNSLLLITLIGIEVKDFMPDHVVVITWIDWFLLANILLGATALLPPSHLGARFAQLACLSPSQLSW